jgi:hypothetical protein
MQVFATFIPLLGCSLLIALLVLRFAERLSAVFRTKIVLLSLTIGLCFISIDQVSVSGYIRGVVADLSITTILMLVAACYSCLSGQAVINNAEKVAAGILLLSGGVLLYPMSLGWGSFDPYQYGYYPILLGALLSGLTLIALFVGFQMTVICLMASLLAYTFRLLDSGNLWDYLIDPLAVVYGTYIVLATLFRQFPRRSSLND